MAAERAILCEIKKKRIFRLMELNIAFKYHFQSESECFIGVSKHRETNESTRPYSPSTRYKSKYALTFLNNGEELGWRKISILSGGPFRGYNLHKVSKPSTL